MKYKRQTGGFSLVEVLMAVGILAVGMMFIAGVFPVAIHFSTVATERTVAAVAADEAFAKIQLYGLHPNFLTLAPVDRCFDYNDVDVSSVPLEPHEFGYPSINDGIEKKYFWSAICKNLGYEAVQVTVFVSRKIRPNLDYYLPDASGHINWGALQYTFQPTPVKVRVNLINPGSDELSINIAEEKVFINDCYTIIDEEGDIYRVLERYSDFTNIIQLDRDWESGGSWPRDVWTIPPAVTGGGKYPCVGVFQRIIKF